MRKKKDTEKKMTLTLPVVLSNVDLSDCLQESGNVFLFPYISCNQEVMFKALLGFI